MAGAGYPHDDHRSLMQLSDGRVNLDINYTLVRPPVPGQNPYRRPERVLQTAPPATSPPDVPIISTPH